MGYETWETYNQLCLIGMTDKRGMAWHWRAEYQGEESNHYPGPIPVGDLKRRLFGWAPIKSQSAALVPVEDESDCNVFDRNGNPVKDKDGNIVCMAMSSSRILVVRSDNYADLGAFKDSYEPHDYNEWLVSVLSNLLGDTLVISSAGLLRNGAQAWVEASFPETCHDDTTGVDYRPNLLSTTSLDGSLATGYFGTTTDTVCDNTMYMAMGGAKNRKHKVKHTKHSVMKIEDARKSLNILHRQQENFAEELHKWAELEIPDKKWVEVMEIIVPSPVDEKESKRAYSLALRKREELNHVYHNDSMCNAWKGTGLGVIKAVNTWQTHYGDVRGATKEERHNERMVKGEYADLDLATVDALVKVLDKPELVAATN